MLIQIHQKAAHFGEGSTSTSSHMNQTVEQENEDQNMHVTEHEPQDIADQVGEKEDQNVHVIQAEPQVVILAHEESLAKVVPQNP